MAQDVGFRAQRHSDNDAGNPFAAPGEPRCEVPHFGRAQAVVDDDHFVSGWL